MRTAHHDVRLSGTGRGVDSSPGTFYAHTHTHKHKCAWPWRLVAKMCRVVHEAHSNFNDINLETDASITGKLPVPAYGDAAVATGSEATMDGESYAQRTGEL